MKEHETEFVRSINNKAIRNGVIFELVLAVIWGLVGRVLNDGWLMAAANIIFLLISFALAGTLVSFLRHRFSYFTSVTISVLLWILIFAVLRGLF